MSDSAFDAVQSRSIGGSTGLTQDDKGGSESIGMSKMEIMEILVKRTNDEMKRKEKAKEKERDI